MGKERSRIQLYLNETLTDILNQLREEKGWKEDITDKEMLKWIILDYQRLSADYHQLKEKLTYMDQNISILLNLQSSMAMEYHIPSYPLKDSLPYFQARKQVESMMNLPRSIQPSPAIQKELQEPTKRWDEKAFREENTSPSIPKSSVTSSSTESSSKTAETPKDEEEFTNYFI